MKKLKCTLCGRKFPPLKEARYVVELTPAGGGAIGLIAGTSTPAELNDCWDCPDCGNQVLGEARLPVVLAKKEEE